MPEITNKQMLDIVNTTNNNSVNLGFDFNIFKPNPIPEKNLYLSLFFNSLFFSHSFKRFIYFKVKS